MFKKLLNGTLTQREQERRNELKRKLIRREAKIGGSLFGPVPEGHRREFFCLDKHTWVWHEEWLNDQGEQKHRTTRYDVRPGGVLKSQDGQYKEMDITEARRLYVAVDLYEKKVSRELYGLVA
jgi:hypothetical protein